MGAGRPPPHSHSLATRGHQRQSAGQWPAVPRRGWGSSAGESHPAAGQHQQLGHQALLGSGQSPGPERHVRVKAPLPRDGDNESPGKLPETSPSEVTLLPGSVPLSPARRSQATRASGQARTLTREVECKQQTNEESQSVRSPATYFSSSASFHVRTHRPPSFFRTAALSSFAPSPAGTCWVIRRDTGTDGEQCPHFPRAWELP